jgi:hypothetical protein
MQRIEPRPSDPGVAATPLPNGPALDGAGSCALDRAQKQAVSRSVDAEDPRGEAHPDPTQGDAMRVLSRTPHGWTPREAPARETSRGALDRSTSHTQNLAPPAIDPTPTPLTLGFGVGPGGLAEAIRSYAASVASQPAKPRTSAAPPAEATPVVRVRIGRVEVHASAAATPATSVVERPQQPGLSLEALLRQREQS